MSDELNQRMTERRILLGLGVSATILLPGWLSPAVAWAATRRRHRRLPTSPASGTAAAHAAPLVMLDPGHGGKDPGAIGVAGTYEKHVSLAAAHDLRQRLEASGRYRVAMTRATDRFIPLEDRVAIAQDRGADLFVSMHADSVADHDVRGASVYTLSTTASDRQTAALAISENDADRFGGPGFTGASPEVARILASLVGRETRVDSANLQQAMVENLAATTEMLPRPARHAAFAVLQSSQIPSVLVEMGFMSNYKDETELRQQAHRARVTQSMANAVDAWLLARQAGRMAG